MLVKLVLGLIQQPDQVLGVHLSLELGVPITLGRQPPHGADHLPLGTQRMHDEDSDRVGQGERLPVDRPVVHASDLLAHLLMHGVEKGADRRGDCFRAGFIHHTFSVTRYSRYRPNSSRVCASSAGSTLSTSPTI